MEEVSGCHGSAGGLEAEPGNAPVLTGGAGNHGRGHEQGWVSFGQYPPGMKCRVVWRSVRHSSVQYSELGLGMALLDKGEGFLMSSMGGVTWHSSGGSASMSCLLLPKDGAVKCKAAWRLTGKEQLGLGACCGGWESNLVFHTSGGWEIGLAHSTSLKTLQSFWASPWLRRYY